MNKAICFILTVIVLSSCNNTSNQQVITLQKQTDSLTALVKKMKPGLGEIMSGIQVHHEKLWFAGSFQNWNLSEYEIGEIKEAFEQAKELKSERPEIKNLDAIFPAVDSLTDAISRQDTAKFRTDFINLTNACNTCHKESGHPFNVITIPTSWPVSDQDFRPRP
jgi:cytochrome c556